MNPNPSVKKEHASVFELNGVPSFGQALPLAMQHVVAMIVGCVTPPLSWPVWQASVPRTVSS